MEERHRKAEIPSEPNEQKRMLRAMCNVRMPNPISDDFLKVQDEYLQCELKEKVITDIDELN